MTAELRRRVHHRRRRRTAERTSPVRAMICARCGGSHGLDAEVAAMLRSAAAPEDVEARSRAVLGIVAHVRQARGVAVTAGELATFAQFHGPVLCSSGEFEPLAFHRIAPSPVAILLDRWAMLADHPDLVDRRWL